MEDERPLPTLDYSTQRPLRAPWVLLWLARAVACLPAVILLAGLAWALLTEWLALAFAVAGASVLVVVALFVVPLLIMFASWLLRRSDMAEHVERHVWVTLLILLLSLLGMGGLLLVTFSLM